MSSRELEATAVTASSSASLQATFTRYGTDDSGEISVKGLEATAATAASSVSLHAAFRRYDADGSGAISAGELGDLCAELGFELDETALDAALKELDTNADGMVGFSEFKAWWDGLINGGDASDAGMIGQLRAIAKQAREKNHIDIHSASYHGSVATVHTFLELDPALGSLPDSSEFGEHNCPLHYAAYCGSVEVCEVLLNTEGSKVNVNARNNAGCTALFLASQQGHVDIVSLLLKHGARINIGDKIHGLSPLDVSGSDEVMTLLSSSCNISTPKRPDAAPYIFCDRPGRISVTWSYRVGGQTSGRSLPVSSFTIQVMRSNEAPNSDYESDSDEDEQMSPNPAGGPTTKFDKVLQELEIKGGDATHAEFKVEFPFPLQVRVAARNASGLSEWSDRSAGVLCASAPTITKPPVVEVLSKTAIKVSWALPAQNGAKLHAFKLEANQNNKKAEWVSMGVFPANVRFTEVQNLRPGLSYSFRIICSNAVGKSKPGPSSLPIKTK